MRRKAVRHSRPPTEPAFVPPYRPSWFDRFVDGIERLPGPAWAFYLAMGFLLFALVTVVQWTSGALPPGRLLLSHAVYCALALGLGVAHYLKRYGGVAFDRFRPALLADETEARLLRYRLTVLPRGGAAWASAFGLAFGLVGFAVNGLAFMEILHLSRSPLSLLLNVTLGPAIWMVFFAGGYLVLRQLTLTRYLFSHRTRVDLFGLEPLYALGGMTARAAVALLILPTSLILLAPRTLEQPVSVYLALAASALASTVFLWPQAGIHRLLVTEKQRRLSEQARRMNDAIDELHRRMDRRQLRQMDDLHKAMASLDLERSTLAKIPTWPWEPGTVRGVAAALALPILIWIVQQLLQPLLAR